MHLKSAETSITSSSESLSDDAQHKFCGVKMLFKTEGKTLGSMDDTQWTECIIPDFSCARLSVYFCIS